MSIMVLDNLDQKYLEWCATDILLFGENGTVLSENEYERFEFFLLNYPNVLSVETLYRVFFFSKSYLVFLQNSGLGEKLSKILSVSENKKDALLGCDNLDDLLSAKDVLDDIKELNYSWKDATLYSIDYVIRNYIMKNVQYIKNQMDDDVVMMRVFNEFATDLLNDTEMCTAIKADAELLEFLNANYPSIKEQL